MIKEFWNKVLERLQKEKREFLSFLHRIYVKVIKKIFSTLFKIGRVILKDIGCMILFVHVYIRRMLKLNKKKNKNKEEKIMILIGKISKGGAERAAVNLADKLSARHKVIIFTFYKVEYDAIYNYECNENVEHIDLFTENSISRYLTVRKMKKKNKITACISFGTRPNIINALSQIGENVIISIRNYLSVSELEFIDKLSHKVSCMLADKVVAVAKCVEKDQILNYNIPQEKICSIANYCNHEMINKSIQEYEIDEVDKPIFENGRIIITMGKCMVQKGQWHLIRAFKEVVKNNSDVKLILLGRGELEKYLKKLVQDLHLENNVFLVGHKNKNVYTYMSKSDLFVFPTLYEGMPNVLLEAMECGLPIIATDCYGGNAEIIAPDKTDEEISEIYEAQYGILVPKLDLDRYDADTPLTREEKILADSINKLINDKEKLEYYRVKSKERVKDFNQEDYVKKWEALL